MIKKLIAFICLMSSVVFAEIDATIPVIDMDEYRDPETREKFITELYEAFQDVGFVAVINTGVDQQVLDDAYAALEEFYHHPFDEKMESFDHEKAGERGYTPGESAKGQEEKDFKEFYSIGREVDPLRQERLGLWENVWPESEDFQEALTTLYQTLEDYKVQFEQVIARAIGVEENFFTKMTSEGDILLRAIHYPANPLENQLWAAEHTDINLFTILPRATAKGLQVQNKQGEWIKVKVPEDAFIINAGDMLENITNGEFHSGLHRVVAANDGYERYSVVYFVHPKSEDRLDPLLGCIERTGGVQKYANTTRLELLEERLVDLGLAPFSMMKHLAESGLMDRLIDLGRASPTVMLKLNEEGLASEKVLEELARLFPKAETITVEPTFPVLDLDDYFNTEE
ncbi:MAG: 2-oxoglutarate-dependent ethylene/succinate-forming enzyme [Chlamydiae bacterium]|nr:2-oxoglutarate-dependent ethylene/succinate-forming enzyme [Chlamydiota bacterium]